MSDPPPRMMVDSAALEINSGKTMRPFLGGVLTSKRSIY